METKIRKTLYEPLVKGALSYLVPDFKINVVPDESICTSALLSVKKSEFVFDAHFLSNKLPKPLQFNEAKRVYTQKDCFSVEGQIDAEIAFRCTDVFPPMGGTSRSRGTSSTQLRSSRLHLIPEGTDVLTGAEMEDLIGLAQEDRENSTASFDAHLIFHGPKLKLLNAGTDIIRKNDFLGEASSGSFDTHLFEGDAYEGALIQQEKELHLHLRSKKDAPLQNGTPEDLIDGVMRATSFALGFHPWPLYYELRKDHRIVERWLSPRLNLKQTFLAPVSDSLWFSLREKKEEDLHRIIPIIAKGLGSLDPDNKNKLNQLLWHFRASQFGDLPHTTQMLILCAVMESLTKLIVGITQIGKPPIAQDVWKQALARLNLSWDNWGKKHFELWRKYRNQLAHGWVFMNDNEMESFNEDQPELGCAFSLMVAAYCGYRGHIISHPFKREAKRIAGLNDPNPL